MSEGKKVEVVVTLPTVRHLLDPRPEHLLTFPSSWPPDKDGIARIEQLEKLRGFLYWGRTYKITVEEVEGTT